jgi:CubicO group peptidase (beta-lactamase class C family)
VTELLPGTARTLYARTARAQRDGRVPGLVAGVVRDGGLAWSAARGDVAEPHRDVAHRLGSITKTVAAITVMRLRDEGRLDLADPLETHLPGTPLGDRTLGQLLSHMGGATSESPGGWWERTPGTTLEGLGLSHADAVLAPARRFHYSNLGFGLLGELVARARGRSWAEVARDEVLLPLGMTRTTPRPVAPAAQGFAVHPWADVRAPEPEFDAVVMAPAGQLWASATDLARLGAFLIGDTGDVLAPATLEEMTVPSGIDAGDAPGWSSYGLGVQVRRVESGATLVGHGGSMPGFLAGLWVDREERTGALALANTTSGLDGGLPAALLADVKAAEPHVVEAWRPAPSPVPVELLGPWYWGPSPYALRAVPGGMLHLGGLGRPGRSSRFRPGPDGTWIGMDGYFAGETLRLDPVALNLATFVFTRTPYDPAAPVPGGTTAWA